jgi:outer membrane protein OmpA-like peptidoglycan-associated protein
VIERMRVFGYTDSVGSAGYNQRLSLRRAQAVKEVLDEALAGSSVKIEITAQGRGISNAYPNTTDEGKAKNRRVTIEF